MCTCRIMGHIVLTVHKIPTRVLTSNNVAFLSLCHHLQVFSQQVGLHCKCIIAAHPFLLYIDIRYFGKCASPQTRLPLPSLPCMTSPCLLLINRREIAEWEIWAKIFEFRSLLCVPYFTHADSMECAALLQIWWWDQSGSARPGSRAQRRELKKKKNAVQAVCRGTYIMSLSLHRWFGFQLSQLKATAVWKEVK